MTDINELVERLRSMSRYEHDYLSIGNEAATALTDLQAKLEARDKAFISLNDDYMDLLSDLSRLKALLAEAGKLQSRERWLRKAADEIAKAGHNGWGNTCLDAADAIAALMEKINAVK